MNGGRTGMTTADFSDTFQNDSRVYGRHRFSVAPMMDWTDRHERYFLRLISRHTLLYTEMVTTAAIIHGDRERLLVYDPAEHLNEVRDKWWGLTPPAE